LGRERVIAGNPGKAKRVAKAFHEAVDAAAVRANSLVCVGLDPDLSKFPTSFKGRPIRKQIEAFNAAVIDATRDLVCAYKPNLGFYAAYGLDGIAALISTREMIPAGIPVILDCKVGDIGSTAAAYARGYFDEWGFDAITANPYMGEDSLAPFLSYTEKGVIIICKTSNAGSGDLQDLTVTSAESAATLYETVAARCAGWNEAHSAGIGLVVGATYPEQLATVRGIAPKLPILLPGVGAQAGELDASVQAGIDANGRGLLVSSSRGITYASRGDDFAEAARTAASQLRDAVNQIRSMVVPA
jgi:orotidine-5'-phosphate decarboxylase